MTLLQLESWCALSPSLLPSMELSSLLQDLHLLSSSEKDPACAAPPPVAKLLSQLQEKLTGPSSDSEKVSLIGRVEVLFQKADWLVRAASSGGDGVELRSAVKSLVSALIGCAALPDCDDDCASLPSSAYQGVPSRASAVCSALTALLGTLGRGSHRHVLLPDVAPDVCVFAVTHFQVSVTRLMHNQRPGREISSVVPKPAVISCAGPAVDQLVVQRSCEEPAGGAAQGGGLERLGPPADG